MKTKLRSLLLSLLLAALCAAGVAAQTATSVTAADPLTALPDSDLVVYADVRRILTELAPRVLAHSPEMLSKVMGAVEMIKTKTGINVLGIERVAVGMKLLGPLGRDIKKENVGIVIVAYGDFDTNAFIAFAKSESKGKISEQTYEGKVIYSEPPPEPPNTKPERERPAFVVLDANTLAVGDLTAVRAAVDAAAGKGRVEPGVVRLATQDPNAVLGVGLNLSPTVVQNISKSVGTDEAMQASVRFVLSTVKQLSLSAGVAPGTFSLALGVRFCDPQQAQGMGDLLTAARRQAMQGEPKLAPLLEGLQVKTEGSDVMVRADLKGEVLQSLGAMFAGQGAGAQPTTTAPPAESPGMTDPKTTSTDPAIKPPTNKPTPRRRSRRRGR
ncbi:MAG TPA: hypothetical protein VJT74_09925 [Pyrinomonadaceae bacterium]|nr:hypothetical protein [Pyrinomonadaceae bacterium]